MQHYSAGDSQRAGIAYHLAPQETWERQKATGSYVPEAFDGDGFIHATNGLERLLWVANEFYTADDRPHVVLVLDVARLTSPMRYDDENEHFPHIYGPLNVDAVTGELPVQRGEGGAFVSIGTEQG